HNRGIGHLENKEWKEAEAALATLAERLPQNVLAARNLAVSRVLTMVDRFSPYSESADAAAFTEGLRLAGEAVEEYRAVAGTDDERAVAELLAGKLAAFADAPGRPRIADALKNFQDAIRLSGGRPTMWYAYARALEENRETADSPQLLDALEKALELAPENLAVITKLLEKQALGLSATNPETKQRAAGIGRTLELAAAQLGPLNAAIVKQHRVDLLELIGKALASGNPPAPAALRGPALTTKNLLLPELAQQIDMRRIDLNLLEYLSLDLAGSLGLTPEQRSALLEQTAPTVLTGFAPADGLPSVASVTWLQLADMNLDGRDDLVLLSGGRVQVYSPAVDGSAWTLLLESPSDLPAFTGLLLADLDRDFDRATLADVKFAAVLLDPSGDRRTLPQLAGQPRWFDADFDLVAWTAEGVVLLKNDVAADGTRQFTPLASPPTVPGVRTAVAADLEADGDLDLAFATAAGVSVWKNLDGSSFEPLTEGLRGPDYPDGLQSLRAVDWNRDMAMDLVGIAPDGRVGWLQNMLHLRFRWNDGLAGSVPPAGAADLAVGDFNRDGNWDVAAAGASGVVRIQLSNNERAETAVVTTVGKAAAGQLIRADFDNDSLVDLLSSGRDGLRLYRGCADGSFEDVSHLLPSLDDLRAATVADIDRDGGLDVVVATATGHLQLLLNIGGSANEWMEIVPRAIGEDSQFQTQRVNMHGTGAVLEVRSGADWQAHVIDAPRMHVGLGRQKQADTIRVIWTDGVPQNITDVSLLRSRLGVLAPQILKGSCPYIYTWDGEKFTFFSDCLWAAPLGLVQATGDLAPTREWEYLLIPGRQLRPRADRYVLQLTEELWEAAYFDEVRLMAVDHPADVSVLTNEKVGSPAMAAHRIHTVRRPVLPRSVINSDGEDLLPLLKAQDQQYAKPFRRRILQGLTDEWTLEFDFGEIPSPADGSRESVRLVLIGWVFPTDTSINTGLNQNPRLPDPAPPRLEGRQADGSWKVLQPFIGFPSGKTKAMVVDVSEAVAGGQLRFRICSSMELYFDHACAIVNEADAATVVQSCELLQADLHYRGFSKRVYTPESLFRHGYGPEGYDYSAVSTAPQWNEMLGRFTRYGETAELLRSQDDRLVVMGPGDELTVEFAVPETAVADGWVRDFVLYNVGWDKDADLSTVYGQSSEPYPTRAMPQYPLNVEQDRVSSEEYERWLREYQTREYGRFQFRDVVRRPVLKGAAP
ncbi:MAG: FG-GAP-like repeat-containing protein, partial [Planctomycetota bacterium]